MIYADDCDNLTEDLETERKFKEKMDLLREDNLMVNDDKAEDTIRYDTIMSFFIRKPFNIFRNFYLSNFYNSLFRANTNNKRHFLIMETEKNFK